MEEEEEEEDEKGNVSCKLVTVSQIEFVSRRGNSLEPNLKHVRQPNKPNQAHFSLLELKWVSWIFIAA